MFYHFFDCPLVIFPSAIRVVFAPRPPEGGVATDKSKMFTLVIIKQYRKAPFGAGGKLFR
ncbi:MAG TPA: hypothetical protein DCQ31_10515 [Bacteroidales bacterium]|nr:hypothetical protein [Bacteroidales bacterium]